VVGDSYLDLLQQVIRVRLVETQRRLEHFGLVASHRMVVVEGVGHQFPRIDQRFISVKEALATGIT
jgi:hypothetical protein